MPIFYILAGLVGMAIGWFIGFLDSNMRTSKKIRVIENNAEMMIEEAERKIAQLKKECAEENPARDDPGLLRLKRTNGHYLLELDGVPAPSELTMDMRKRLIELITVFRLWLEPAQFSSSSPQPVTPASRPVEPDPIREAVYGAGEPDQFFDKPVPDPVSLTSPLKPASPQVDKKPQPEKNIASLSIVQQIDSILQKHIERTPLARQGIRLQESAQGGVEVYVGLKKFDAVDDVPDNEIKAAIRSAIAEWEKKYTPGM
jgi:hypothetical protein